MMAIGILIPAYNPDARLVSLVRELHRTCRFCTITIVDDGSRGDCRPIFDQLAIIPGVVVLHHAVNLGKGAALKTGLNHICCALPHCLGLVTADADGQHLVRDILSVAECLEKNPDSLILGSRQFTGGVPLRSRLGNMVTRYAFWALIGKRLTDTQSGLRGIPRSVACELLHLTDTGYEFELDMLIRCKHSRVPIVECPIATVYLEDNRSSHFNPIVDSLKIYWVLLRFVAASLVTAAVDNVVFLLVFGPATGILMSQALARLVAGTLNYCLARRAVFHSRAPVAGSALKFMLLVIGLGAVSYTMIQAAVHAFGCSVILAKISSELLIYLANFVIQRELIFRQTREVSPLATETAPPPSLRIVDRAA